MTQGDIELESGPWHWTVTDLEGRTEAYGAGARPAGEADPTARVEDGRALLLLEDPKDPDHWMSRRLPTESADEPLPEAELKRLARNPDRRNLMDEDGTVWKFERIERPEPVREGAESEHASHKVTALAGSGPARTLSLPDDRRLGTATWDEMVELVR